MALTTFQTLSDAQLISAFLAGSKPAFETLLLRHKDRIYTAIYLLVKDRERAEDLFQDCFLKILTTLQDGRYNEQGKFLPWAMRVAHNLCMDFFRRRKPSVDMGKVEFLLQNTDGHNAADAACEQQQTEASLRGMLEKLPPEQQKVVTLRIYGELSFKEIAELTNVSINTALGRMRYGLLNLRKMIEADPKWRCANFAGGKKVMQTPLFYEEAGLLAGTTLTLGETNTRHLVQVLRKSTGYLFRLTDGKGAEAHAVLEVAGKKSAGAKIISVVQHLPASPSLTLAVAFTKTAARNEWLLEKATELGLHRIVPLLTQRTESEKFKEVRWRGILVSALQQSGQFWLPHLLMPQKWNAFLEEEKFAGNALFIAHCEENGPKTSFSESLTAGKNAILLIGPEGDFSPAEIAGALAKGFVPVSLGKARLRTETAAIAGASYFRLLNDA